MGVVIGQRSTMGEMLSETEADAMIFGFTLLNDWSARDIQQWEYVPLGPFQAKAFATSISPWIVTREALEPFRMQGPTQDPIPLPYSAAKRFEQLRRRTSMSTLRSADIWRRASYLPHQFQVHVLVIGPATHSPCFVGLLS